MKGEYNASSEQREISFSGFLELVYGILFEPVPTLQNVAERNPVVESVLIFTMVNVIAAVMSGVVISQMMYMPHEEPVGRFMQASAPLLAVSGLIFQYVKWFFYSGLLHLLAEFLGGRGRARGVFTVAGLASLPSIFLIPVELLLFLLGVRGMAMTAVISLSGLAVLIWGMVLLVLGLREVHAFSTARSLTVVLLPVVAAIVLGVIVMGMMMAGATMIAPWMTTPRW